MLHADEYKSTTVRGSELILSDRLIALAQAAEHAGFCGLAGQLVRLACEVFDEADTRH